MRLLPVLILIGLILLGLYIPVQIPWEFVSIGKIYPRQEWRILRDASGNITSSLQDYRTGTALGGTSYQFKSGDLVQAELSVHPDSTGFVQAGDTILHIYTTLITDQLITLRGQLLVEKATLTSQLTGEKTPVVLEAENKVLFAEQQFGLQQKNYNTSKTLFDEGLISLIEFRTAENEYESDKIDVEIAKKNLETVQTGLKREDVNITRSRIASLEQQIAFLEKQQAKYVLTSPITGRQAPVSQPDEMLLLQKTDEYIVQIPVKAEDMKYIGDLKKITLTDVQNLKTYEATLVQTGSQMMVVAGKQVNFLLASVHPPSPAIQLSTGMSVTCKLSFGSINQREYISRVLNFSWTKK